MSDTPRIDQDKAASLAGTPWLSGVRSLLNYRIGIIPLPVYVILFALMLSFSLTGQINNEMNMMIAALALGRFTCAEVGMHIPFLRNFGRAALVTICFPSYLADAHLLPLHFIQTVTTFTNSSNFIYLYISAIVVGSILTMDRKAMVRSFLKIFVPLAAGSVAAMIVGMAVGWLAGLGAWRSLFFVEVIS